MRNRIASEDIGFLRYRTTPITLAKVAFLMRLFWLLNISLLTARILGAQAADSQAPSSNRSSVLDIRAIDIARYVEVLNQDSMMGESGTPSRGLERTAQYVADQFKILGLEPAGDNGGWIQHYPLPRHLTMDAGASGLAFVSKPKHSGKPVVNEAGEPVVRIPEIYFRTAAAVATDTLLDSRAPGASGAGQGTVIAAEFYGPEPIVVAGPHTLASARQANLRDRVVIYVPFAGSDSTTQQQILQVLRRSNHVIVVADEDSVAFAARRRAAEAHPPVVLDWYLPDAQSLRRWVMYVWAPAIESGLATAGFELGAARTALAPIVRPVNAVALLHVEPVISASPTMLNTLGMLRGSQSDQVVVITTHMGQAGQRRDQQPGVTNGADDNVSDLAVLIALAKAFTTATRSGQPLRRSILFAAVSGGAGEYWGSSALIDKLGTRKIALDLHLGALGHGARDSVRINGLQDVELPIQPAWLAARRPELHLAIVDDGGLTEVGSDHLAFVQAMIPSLYVHRGNPAVAGMDTANDSAFDAEHEARIAHLVFALAREIADRSGTPHWTVEGRRQRGRIVGR